MPRLQDLKSIEPEASILDRLNEPEASILDRLNEPEASILGRLNEPEASILDRLNGSQEEEGFTPLDLKGEADKSLENLRGLIDTARRVANVSSAKVLDTAMPTASTNRLQLNPLQKQELSDTPVLGTLNKGLDYASNMITAPFDYAREKLVAPAFKETPTKFEKKYDKPIWKTKGGTTIIPSAGELARMTGEFLPETLATMALKAPVGRLAKASAPWMKRALTTGAGGALGAVAKGEPEDAMMNAVMFAGGDMLGSAMGAGIKGAAKGVGKGIQKVFKRGAPVVEDVAAVPRGTEAQVLPETFALASKKPEGITDTAWRLSKNAVKEVAPDATLTEKNRALWSKATKYAEREGLSEKATQQLYSEMRDATQLGRPSKVLGQKARQFANTTNALNLIEERTGIPTGQYGYKLVEAEAQKSHVAKAIRSLGDNPLQKPSGGKIFRDPVKARQRIMIKNNITPEETSRLLQYIDTTPEGTPFFNPTAHKITRGGRVTTDVPAYEGKVPTNPEVLNALFEERKFFDLVHEQYLAPAAKDLGKEVGYTPRYVPYKDKIPGIAGGKGGGIHDPKMMAARSGREVPLEKDYWKLRENYIESIARHKTLRKVLHEADQIDMQLRALGKDDMAEYVEKATAYAFGFKDPKTVRKFRAQDLVLKSEKELERIAREELGLAPDKIDKFVIEMKNQMYHSWIGMNPKNLVAQIVQPEVSGAAEVGARNIATVRINKAISGILNKISKTKKFGRIENDAVAAVRDRLRQAQFNPLEVASPDKLARTRGMVSKVLSAPGKPGMKLQDIVDQYGREVVFLAGRRQFLNSKNPAYLMGDLLVSERQIIRDALKSGGKEAAAREYGLLRSQRIMARFSAFDKPEILRNKFGETVFFTSFVRSETNKLAENVRTLLSDTASKEVKARTREVLAKRIGYPLLLSAALGATGNESLREFASYVNPQMAIPNMFRIGVMAPVTSAAQSTARYGPKAGLKSAAKTTALPKLLMSMDKKK